VSRRVGAPDRQKVVGWFLEDLRNAGQPLENRLYLIDALKGMGGKEIRLALKDLLRDEKEDVRVQIARGLAEEWDEETVEWLIPALEDREWRVRIAVIGALGSLCEKKPEGVASTIGPKAGDRLLRMMSEDQDNIVREKAQTVHTKIQERAC